MLYLGGKRNENGGLSATYALLNAEDMVRDIINIIINDYVDKVGVYVAKTENDELVDITEQLADADWTVYNCPAFDQDYYLYHIPCTIKDEEDINYIISIFVEEEGVTFEIENDRNPVDEDSSVPPFFAIVDRIENLAHYNCGYRSGLIDYRTNITNYFDGIDEALDDMEGTIFIQFGVGDLYKSVKLYANDDERLVEDSNSESNEDDEAEYFDMVPSENLGENAREILEEEFDGRRIGKAIYSNPIIIKEDEEYSIAVMFTEYTEEEAKQGYIGRPTGAVIFDIKGNPYKIGFERYIENNPSIKKISGTRFSTTIKNAENLDFSDEYYEKAYNKLDVVRGGIIVHNDFDSETFNEYMGMIMANVPDSYKPFYYAIASDKESSVNKYHEPKQLETYSNAVASINEEETVKIGQLVRSTMAQLINSHKLNASTVEELQDESHCRELFHIGYPMLKKIVREIPVNEQIKINGQNRYWKDTYEIDGEHYVICSQWYESNRKHFIAWLESL